METIFVLTHTIMIICAIAILYFSILLNSGSQEGIQKPLIPYPLFRVSSIKIAPITLYRTAAGLLALLIR